MRDRICNGPMAGASVRMTTDAAHADAPAPKRRPVRFCPAPLCGIALVPYNPGPFCYVHTPLKVKVEEDLRGVRRNKKGSPI